MELLTGFLVGLLGSFHCAGMCGPIALALPIGGGNLLLGRILYNFGRIITYSLLGLLFGLLGNRIALFGFQQTLTISIGVIILIAVLLPYKYKSYIASKSGFYKIFNSVKSSLGFLLRKHNKSSLLGIGIFNGLLPCGFVYIGATGAAALADPLKGMLFMAMFGLGTIPVMLGASLIGSFVNFKIRTKLVKMVPVFSLILAAVFIMRGLNLGIPYLSPKLSDKNKTTTEEVICH